MCLRGRTPVQARNQESRLRTCWQRRKQKPPADERPLDCNGLRRTALIQRPVGTLGVLLTRAWGDKRSGARRGRPLPRR
jgi:hypothetical protein